jgi:hypothetical protein
MADSVALQLNTDEGPGVTWNAMGATDVLRMQKAGAHDATSAGRILVGEANGGMHVETDAGVDVCDVAHAHNIAYVAAGTCSIDGAGTEDVANILTTECIRAHVVCDPTNGAVTAAEAFVYGSTEADAPTGFTAYGVKQAGASWSNIGGSAAALDLGTSASAATHDLYFAVSVVPTARGSLSGTLKVAVELV